MKHALENYSAMTLAHEADKITGYALTCLGTLRSAFWSTELNNWTYDEWQATIYHDKEDAIEEILAENKRDLWQYLMLVPVIESKRYLLPTVMGVSVIA